jgi:hypothetical protein
MTPASRCMAVVSMDRELLRGPSGNPMPRRPDLADPWSWGIHWARVIEAARRFGGIR